LIAIRRARTADAAGIGAVHVASWRSAYAGVLPDAFLAQMSAVREARHYDRVIRIGVGVHVAAVSGPEAEAGPAIVGFTTACRTSRDGSLAEGMVQTLYVLDDFRDRGIGRRLLRASAQYLAGLGCRSAYAWVLRDNNASYFYQRLGGKRIAEGATYVGGQAIPQTAYAWDPIALLLDVDA